MPKDGDSELVEILLFRRLDPYDNLIYHNKL